MRAKKFEYTKGRAKTEIPWFRPDPELLNSWKREFLQISGVEKYKFWICGGVLETWKTWDTDILVTGEISSYDELQNILVSATQLGFNHRQLIDVNWNNSLGKYLEKGPCKRRSICCNHHLHNNTCTMNQCISDIIETETICIANTIVKNGVVMNKGAPGAIKLNDSLWKLKVTYPSDKQVQRLKNKVTYKGKPTLLTPNLDFKTIVQWP